MKEVIDQDTITNGGESSQFETKEVLDKEIDINEGKLPQKELGKVSMIETNTV